MSLFLLVLFLVAAAVQYRINSRTTQTLRQFMSDITERLTAAVAEAAKVKEEVIALKAKFVEAQATIADLRAQLEAAGATSPEVLALLDQLDATLAETDAVNDDEPADTGSGEQTPEDTGGGNTGDQAGDAPADSAQGG